MLDLRVKVGETEMTITMTILRQFPLWMAWRLQEELHQFLQDLNTHHQIRLGPSIYDRLKDGLSESTESTFLFYIINS